TDFLENLSQQFDKLLPFLPGQGQPQLRQLRKESFQQACTLGLPSLKHPAWKHARLEILLQTPFGSMLHATKLSDLALISPFISFNHPICLVFINGFLDPGLSRISKELSVSLQHLAKVGKTQPELLADFMSNTIDHAHFFKQIN